MNIDKVTEIFCLIDDFCIEFEKTFKERVLPENASSKQRNRRFKLSDSEVITILIMFHLGQFRNLKHFYQQYVVKHLNNEFPETVSYNRFTELQRKALLPMAVFMKMCCLGQCTGISFIDSTPIKSCHIKKGETEPCIQGHGHKGTVFNGLVLWVQVTFGDQRQRRNT